VLRIAQDSFWASILGTFSTTAPPPEPASCSRDRQCPGESSLSSDYGNVARWQCDALSASLASLQKLEEIESQNLFRDQAEVHIPSPDPSDVQQPQSGFTD
jgi:hypothetical protein